MMPTVVCQRSPVTAGARQVGDVCQKETRPSIFYRHYTHVYNKEGKIFFYKKMKSQKNGAGWSTLGVNSSSELLLIAMI